MSREALRAAAEAEVARWEQAITDELLRLFERQEAVVLARLQGTKARKHTRHWQPAGDRPLEVKQIIDPVRWVMDAAGSLGPLVRRLFASVYARVAKQLDRAEGPAAVEAVEAAVQARLSRVADGVETATREVEEFITRAEADGKPMAEIADGVRGVYAQRAPAWAARIATASAVGSINQAALFAAMDAGSSAKQWISSRDSKVRDTHVAADGQVRLLDERFKLGGIPTHPKRSLLMFPGDPGPQVPADEVINCRCTLVFSPPRRSVKAYQDTETKVGEEADGIPAMRGEDSRAEQDECSCCGGSGEHLDGHECYVCDASGLASEQRGEVCEGHHGRPDDGPENAEARYGAGFVHKSLEVKDRVRTAAGAAHYGQPIGSIIKPNLAPAFTTPTAAATGSGSSSPSRPPRLGTIAGGRVADESADPATRALVAKYVTPAPDPATSRILAMRDRKGRVGAFVVWQSEDGAVPKGTVLAVSVHPSLKGQRIGDQMVALAASVDPSVTPTARPARAAAPAAPARATSASSIPDLTRPGDQPGTSGDFDADAARIDRLQRAYLRDRKDTSSLYSRGGRWSRAREKQQQDVIDHFLTRPGVKADGKLLVIGGLPGAGKTTTINSPSGQAALGINLDEYVTVNADEVKAEMVARGMVPDYPGLTADEAATLYHAESFEIAHSLMRQAAKRRLNFAYDTSLKSSGQMGFATAAAARSGQRYETTVLFVDVSPDVAKARAKARYLAGGRYMPLGLIDKMRPYGRRGHASLPAENFDVVKRDADQWFRFDNGGVSPSLVDQGTKRAARRPAAAAAPVPAAPAVRPAAVPVPAVATSSAGAAASLPAALPPVPAGALVYAHPQGKHVYVLPDGSMQVYKPDGKRATSFATPQKLAAGYGGWQLVVGPGADPAAATAAAAQVTPPAPTTPAALVPGPKVAPVEQPSLPAPAGAMPVAPMDFNEASLADVPKFIADDDYVFQQKVDGIRGVLVVEAGKAPWFASKKGDRLQSSTAAKITGPMLAKLPATPAGSPSYRVEGELLNGKFHVFDMVVVGQESTDYETRKTMADAWVASVAPALPGVEALPTARTAAEKQALWDSVLKSGAEGVMMKRRDSPYNGGARVNHTLKAKVTATADVVVLERNRDGKDNAVFGMRAGGKVVELGTVSTGGKDKALGYINVGDVVEVEYLWATPGVNTLTQPRIVRKRPDKTPNDATDVSQLRFVDKTVLALTQKAAQMRLEYSRLTFEGGARAVGV